MANLRAERERRGLTLDEVAERARIPRRYLAALEEGDHEVLPKGPFWSGYRKQYLVFLGLEEAEGEERTETTAGVVRDPERPTPTAVPLEAGEATAPVRPKVHSETLSMLRLVAGAFLVTMALVLGFRLLGHLGRGDEDPRPEDPPPAPVAVAVEDEAAPGEATDLEVVRLRATEPIRVKVTADGQVVQEGTFAPGRTTEFRARERIEVDAENLTMLSVWYDGERIEPLGNLSQGRRLVFIHDGAR